MQTRKVEVEIKTVDDRHCDGRCEFALLDICTLHNEFRGVGEIGYIRTAECIKAEKGRNDRT